MGEWYVVEDYAGPHGLQVFDLTQLRDVQNPPVTFAATNHYAGFGNSHNLAVDEETGFLYAVARRTRGPGSRHATAGSTCSISRTPPPRRSLAATPPTATCTMPSASSTGVRTPSTRGARSASNSHGYTGALSIVDVTDKALPVRLTWETYDGVVFTHQGWLTEDGAFFLVNDELDELGYGHGSRTYVWDVRDLDARSWSGTTPPTCPPPTTISS